jgi:hypothetical protein
MAIYNWKENCEKILKTKQYTTYKKSFYEQIVFIKYLQNQDKSKEEVYNIWINTKSPQLHILQEDNNNIEINLLYHILWKKAENCKVLNKEPTKIKLFQEEIDYINSLYCEEWFRKYLIGLLFFYKFFNSSYLILTKDINIDILSKLNKKEFTDRQIQIANEYREKYSLYITQVKNVQNNQERALQINYCYKEGVLINEYTDPLQFTEVFSLLKKGTALCEKCKTIYTINARTKRDICLECYKKERQQYINNFKKQKRKNL